jgi:zinc protease
MALTVPRFDTDAVERARAQLVSQLQRQSTSPNDIASRTWWQTAFPDHPYGRPISGTLDSIPRITIDDLKTYTRRVLARGKLTVAIVGDIDSADVGTLLDRTFGALPAEPTLTPVPDAVAQGLGRRIVVPMDVPQAVVTFGTRGIGRGDPDFMAAYLVNHILGGGAFSSRLYQEVREKRGLAYSVFSYRAAFEETGALAVYAGTSPERAAETLAIVGAELDRLVAEGGITEKELVGAKGHLTGSLALSLESSSSRMHRIGRAELTMGEIPSLDEVVARVEAVGPDDVARVIERVLGSGDRTLAAVGPVAALAP